MRTWYFKEGNQIIQETLEVTLDYINMIWKTNGPFDGLIGFSMGGTVASLITTFPERFPGLKFVIVGGAADIQSHLLNNNGESKIPNTIRSLHLIGLADNVVPPTVSHLLATRYTNPTIIEHEQGHCIPTRAIQLDGYVKFIEQFLLKDLSSSSTPTTLTSSSSASSSSSSTTVAVIVTAPPLPPPTPLQSSNNSNSSNSNENQSHPLVESIEACNLQREEIDVLGSIYSSTEFEVIGDLPKKVSDPTVKCKVILNPSFSCSVIPENWIGNLGLQFTLQSLYPTKKNQVPRIEIISGSLSLLDFSLAHRRSLLQCVQQVALDICQNEGETCIMQCIQAGNDWLSDGGKNVQNNNNISPYNKKNSLEEDGQTLDDDDNNNNSALETDLTNIESSSILSDVDEQVENEWIKNATMEAGQAAALAKKIGVLDLDLTHQTQSQDNIVASASARGVWNYTIGLVGKPSAGKVIILSY